MFCGYYSKRNLILAQASYTVHPSNATTQPTQIFCPGFLGLVGTLTLETLTLIQLCGWATLETPDKIIARQLGTFQIVK